MNSQAPGPSGPRGQALGDNSLKTCPRGTITSPRAGEEREDNRNYITWDKAAEWGGILKSGAATERTVIN